MDNCRSRRYRSSDGLTICQYGHVMEGNFEYNDDQDQAVVSTKRLNVVQLDDRGTYTRSQRLNEDSRDTTPKRVPGRRSTQIYYRCLQILLKEQLEAVIHEYFSESIRQDLSQVVRINWVKCLSGLEELEDKADEADEAATENGTENGTEEESHTETQTSSEAAIEASLAPNLDPTTKSSAGITKKPFKSIRTRHRPLTKLHLNSLDTLSIIYISVLQLRFQPLFTNDVVDGIVSNKLPYIRTLHLVPKFLLDEIPLYFHRMLQGYKLPVTNEVYEAVYRNGARIYMYSSSPTTTALSVPINLYYPLIFKVVTEVLVLPNAVDVFLLLVLVMKDDMSVACDKAYQNSLTSFPELKIAGMVVFLVKKSFVHNIFPHRLDGARWLEKLKEYEADVEYTSTGDDDPHKLLDWSDEKVGQYCDWVFENIIPKNKTHPSEDLPVMEKRLLQIFDIESGTSVKPMPPSDSLANVLRSMAHPTRAKKLQVKTLEEIEEKLVRKLAKLFGVTEDVLCKCAKNCERIVMRN